jgi:DNA repair protein RadC
MASLLASYTPADIFGFSEVKAISTKSEEQAVLVFGSEDNRCKVLCGESCNETWAVIPPVNVLIQWLSRTKEYFHEAVVLHNHPHIPWHGEIIPSDNDIAATEFLKWQLALLGIRLMDHIIVSGDKKQSLSRIDLYQYHSPLKANGFEIKRFIYCFLVQVSVVIKTPPVLNQLIDALEKNLDEMRHYYEQPHYSRIFKSKPSDVNFKKRLLGLSNSDMLIDRLANFLINLDNNKKLKLQPEKIIPYGLELQAEIVTSKYELR